MTAVTLVAVAGGSCSGKTSLVRLAMNALGPEVCSLLLQDNYYFDRPEAQTNNLDFNFDHPDAIDFALMRRDLQLLKSGQAVQSPSYDFSRHVRTPGAVNSVAVRPLILIDGILILCQPELRALFDLTVFIECSDEIRLQRRLVRDVRERGREAANVIAQFETQVRPMHEAFVQPTAEVADWRIEQPDVSRELSGESDVFVQRLNALVEAR